MKCNWVLKAARLLTTDWAAAIINGSLLEETLIKSAWKKPNLVADDVHNDCPVANIPFISKLVVANQLRALLGETNALDLFQSRFRPHHVMEMALVALQDALQGRPIRAKRPCWSSSTYQWPLILSTTVSS